MYKGNNLSGRAAVVLFVVLATACSSSMQQQYQQEADAFCALYAPERWSNTQDKSALNNLSLLNQQIREVIKSDAFLDIFERLSKTDYTDFYAAIQPEISQLTGKQWQCEDARNFYAIEWEKEGTSDTGKNIIYTLSADGVLQIGDKNISYTDVMAVKAELLKNKNEKGKVIVKVPEGFSEQALSQLLVPFREAGIMKLSIAYY